MGTCLRLLEVELGPTHNHLMTMLDEMTDEILEIQSVRTAVHEGDVIHAEA